MQNKKNIVILTGAGISAESGIKTFRDSDGLWENHRIEDVATFDAWQRNRELVLDFYNQRRRQLLTCAPNEAHKLLVKLEEKYHVQIITQNVDDLHERAGSTNILHLHGELLKVRSTLYESLIHEWHTDLNIGDKCNKGAQLRPHIVWFGEQVPMMEAAGKIAAKADIFITGDVKYHDFFEAENKILIADIGHFESEQFTKDIFYEIITKKMPTFAVRISETKTNPINYL